MIGGKVHKSCNGLYGEAHVAIVNGSGRVLTFGRGKTAG